MPAAGVKRCSDGTRFGWKSSWRVSCECWKEDSTENYLKATSKLLMYLRNGKPVKHFRTTQAFTQRRADIISGPQVTPAEPFQASVNPRTFTFSPDLLREICTREWWYTWKRLVNRSILKFMTKCLCTFPFRDISNGCVWILLHRFNSLVQVILLDPGWLHSRHVSIPRFSHWLRRHLDICLANTLVTQVVGIVCHRHHDVAATACSQG